MHLKMSRPCLKILSQSSCWNFDVDTLKIFDDFVSSFRSDMGHIGYLIWLYRSRQSMYKNYDYFKIVIKLVFKFYLSIDLSGWYEIPDFCFDETDTTSFKCQIFFKPYKLAIKILHKYLLLSPEALL